MEFVLSRNLVKWRTKICEQLEIGKAKKAAVLPAIPEEKIAAPKQKDVSGVIDSDEENEADVELEEQIQEALDSEKKIEKKFKKFNTLIV